MLGFCEVTLVDKPKEVSMHSSLCTYLFYIFSFQPVRRGNQESNFTISFDCIQLAKVSVHSQQQSEKASI